MTQTSRAQTPRPSRSIIEMLGRKTLITIVVGVITFVLSGLLSAIGAGSVLTFVVSAVALAALASLVGDGTEQLGARLGPGATGVLQSALGNLPEFFISIFALRAGLVTVVQAALAGSILANSLLVLGIAFVVGGFKNGAQRFQSEGPRTIVLMTMLSVAAIAIPSIAKGVHTPAGPHIGTLSVIVAIVLLIVFAASVVVIVQGGGMSLVPGEEGTGADHWPLWLAIALLALAGVGAAFVSDWFVAALTPAASALHISQGFTGLVIVAIAGNAVENVVGVQLAAKNQADLAISVILNSSLQIALALIPALVLVSFLIGTPHLTLVFAPLLIVGLGFTALISTIVVYDGESTWIEGMALIGLYAILAASFWWG